MYHPIATNVENKMQHFKSFGNIVAKKMTLPPDPYGHFWVNDSAGILPQFTKWQLPPSSGLWYILKCEESDKGLSLQEMKCKFLRLLVMYICDVIR